MKRHPYAQTITQLTNQLLAKDMPLASILKIRNAYAFAMEVFSCRFQQSGKTFLSHVVGTASILASVSTDASLIAAGLLHNVYENGDFGCRIKQVSPRNRVRISSAVGEEVEQYVIAFRRMRWNPRTIPGIYQNLEQFDAIKRGAILLRLADWLEHHLDLGECYRPPSKLRNAINESSRFLMADIMTKMGHADLGSRILSTIEENTRAGRYEEGCAQETSQRSEVIIPKSCRTRLGVVACGQMRSGLTYIRKLCRPAQPWTVSPQVLRQSQVPPVSEHVEGAATIRYPYAQTSLQLINQLRASGYSPGDLRVVESAYGLAVSLVTGIYRPSWKSVLSHFVGVASILATFGAQPKLVAAGVVHNAYRNGDFGTGCKGMTPEKRKYVRATLGTDIEAYLAGFATLKWTIDSLPAIFKGLPALNELERSVVWIRLADHLERFLDQDIVYCGEKEKQKYFDQTPGVLKVAYALGYDAMALEIEKRVTEVSQCNIPDQLQTDWTDSYFIKPQSLSLRSGVHIKKQLKQKRRRLQSVFTSLFRSVEN